MLHLELGVVDLALVDRLVLVVSLGGVLCDDEVVRAAALFDNIAPRRYLPVLERVEHDVALEV